MRKPSTDERQQAEQAFQLPATYADRFQLRFAPGITRLSFGEADPFTGVPLFKVAVPSYMAVEMAEALRSAADTLVRNAASGGSQGQGGAAPN